MPEIPLVNMGVYIKGAAKDWMTSKTMDEVQAEEEDAKKPRYGL